MTVSMLVKVSRLVAAVARAIIRCQIASLYSGVRSIALGHSLIAGTFQTLTFSCPRPCNSLLHHIYCSSINSCLASPNALAASLLAMTLVYRRDQLLYKQKLGDSPSAPEALTSADDKHRYADGVVDEHRGRLIIIREDHSGEGEAVNTVAAVGMAAADASGTATAPSGVGCA